jgi:GT2 family glycosyltransferase
MDHASPIGVVIVTRDRRDGLLSTLARVSRLAERPPIVVVDNGSRDGTGEAVRAAFPQVDVVCLRSDRGTGARNVGARRLATRYVAFLDDDCWWAEGALATAVRVLDRHARVALLAARVLVGSDARLDPTCAAMAASPLPAACAEPGPAILGFVAAGVVIRREALLACGGFEERYGIGGEEARLAVALASRGWELRYVPGVVAHHHPVPSPTRAGRAARVLRNDLWTTWAARPLVPAIQATVRAIRASGWRRATWVGVLGALRGVPWIARERRVVPPGVERALRLLERDDRAAAGSA